MKILTFIPMMGETNAASFLSEKGNITIYTADGAIVKQMIKDRGYMAIDMSELKSGMYFVRGFGRVYDVMVK